VSQTSDIARAGIEDRLQALFDRISRLSDAELRLLRLSWNEGEAQGRAEIWQKARSVARKRNREDLLEDARSRLAAWVNNYLSATSVEYGTFLTGAGSGMDPTAVRADVVPPVMDAVAAIVAADGLDPEERELLSEPMSRVRRRTEVR
jgi:hypothetical protein